jgi:hypothetical protein
MRRFRGGSSGQRALTECAQVEHTRATTLVVYLAGKAFTVTFVGVVVLTLKIVNSTNEQPSQFLVVGIAGIGVIGHRLQ